jgi:hypothetical protein
MRPLGCFNPDYPTIGQGCSINPPLSPIVGVTEDTLKSEMLALRFNSVHGLATLQKCHCTSQFASLFPSPSGGGCILGAAWDFSPLKPSAFPMNPSCQLLDHEKFWQMGHSLLRTLKGQLIPITGIRLLLGWFESWKTRHNTIQFQRNNQNFLHIITSHDESV